MQPVKRVRCAHVGQPVNQGVSGAWTVVGSDRATYVVKFNTPRDHTALNELACACIAEQLGLPSFEPVLLDLDDRQAAEINEGRAGAGFKIAAGVHFGTRLVKPFYTIDALEKAIGVNVDDIYLSNSDQIPDVLGFDTLVQNNDRHCNNVCIAEDPVADTYSFSIFDHSHAFGRPDWSPQSLADLYQKLEPIQQFCLPTRRIDVHRDFDRFLGAVNGLLVPVLEYLAHGGVPAEWGKGAVDGMLHIHSALVDIDRDDLKVAMRGLVGSGGGL